MTSLKEIQTIFGIKFDLNWEKISETDVKGSTPLKKDTYEKKKIIFFEADTKAKHNLFLLKSPYLLVY